jgi:cytochrome c oxidase subunit 2
MTSRARLLTALAFASAVAACATERSALSPAGPAARTLARLGWPLLVGFLAVSAIMWGLIAWVAWRRTGTLEEHAPPDAKGGLRWVAIGGFVIPGAAFAAAFVGTLNSMSAFPMDHHPHHDAEIRVLGHQWWWEVQYRIGEPNQYVVTANEVHIPVGQPVDLQLVSADVIHSFWAPRLHGKVDLIPGMDNRIRIQADQPGMYHGACAEFCGLQHAHMAFAVIADPPAQYAQWAARQRMSAVAPQVTGQLQEGAAVFQSSCGACHAVRGSDALGRLGPDLTHVASRLTIGAGTYDNTAPNLDAWIRDAQAMKPGVLMPVMDLHQRDVAAVVAYLQTLR